MKKRILVTGGAGYIGSHTVHYLLENGIKKEDIIVFDNLVYGHKDFVPSGVQFVLGDLLIKKNINKVFKENDIDVVLHFAGYAFVAESLENPSKYLENNVIGGTNLLDAMLKGNCKKIIFSSSCTVHGIPKKNPITERMRKNPINVYGESKLMFEKILRWYSKIYGISSVTLRYFNAAGAGFGIGEKHNPEPHLIPQVLKSAKTGKEPVKIFGDDYDSPDGTCVRDFIHVVDLADAHLKTIKFLERKNIKEEDFNLGTGAGVSVAEIIDLSRKITKKKIKTVVEDRRPGDPAVLIADPSKAQKVLGWKAKHDIKKTIGDAWKWHKKEKMKISVVIATKNEEDNIERCLKSLQGQKFHKSDFEIIIVDHGSTDNTVKLAKKYTNNIYSLTEFVDLKKVKNFRGAQVNLGVSKSKGEVVFFPDADMTFDKNLFTNAMKKIKKSGALFVPETVIGKGFFGKVRGFERSFYNQTSIDGVRFVKRSAYKKIGGFDVKNILFGPDDWDITKRLKNSGVKVAITDAHLFHHEEWLTPSVYVSKKGKYMHTFESYINKWGRDDPDVKKQFGLYYRYLGVFFEDGKWKKVFSHPLLMLALIQIRFLVGLRFIKDRISRSIGILRN